MLSEPQKILFIDTTHQYLPDELTKCGFICDYLTDLNYEGYSAIIHNYTGVIVRSGIKLDMGILLKANKLRFIGRVGAGLENIDVDFAREKGIVCMNAPEGNRDALAEHTVGMLLSLFNHLNRADKEVRQGLWNREKNRGIELMGKTVGIIGYGNMGSAFAKRLKGFDVNVIAFDKYKTNYSDQYCRETTLEEVKEEADILSIHVPLNTETTYMVNDQFINSFQKNICIINTSRGRVLNTADLLTNLDSGKVFGAVLDVLEYEDLSFEDLSEAKLPDPFYRLAENQDVILSPHIAGWSVESKLKLAKVLVEKIKRAFGL